MLQIVYLLVAGLLAGFYYYFVGAGPGPSELFEDLEWWRPRGWLMDSDAMLAFAEMADSEGPERWIPTLLLMIPPVALAVGGFLLFKSATMRAFSFWLGTILCVVAYYGVLAERVWRFFEWRFIAVAAGFTAVVTVILFGPSLLRQLARIPRVLVGVLLLALFAGVFLLQTEVTGTNADLSFNISPWPVITVFGMLLVGFMLASLHIAAGSGLYASTRLSGAGGWLGGVLVAAVVAAVSSFLIFTDPSPARVLTFALLGAAYMALARWLTNPQRTPLTTSAISRVAAGALVILMVSVANESAQSNQVRARDETAKTVLLALEKYKKDHDEYPERLKHLVPDYLPELPRPQIGLILHEDDEFEYANFGDSYALEFASVQWVQCAYSPPYQFAEYDESEDADYADGDEESEAWEDYDDAIDVAAAPDAEDQAVTERLRAAGLEGSWNCPKEPPKVW
jgi:hypothetical protein